MMTLSSLHRHANGGRMRLSDLARMDAQPDLGAVGKLALLGVGAFVAIKTVEILTDEEFDGPDFPASFRRRFIDEHVERHGTRCPGCRRRVGRQDLTVDHIRAVANGGWTSHANAQVLCMSCNSSKGARNTPLDFLKGR